MNTRRYTENITNESLHKKEKFIMLEVDLKTSFKALCQKGDDKTQIGQMFDIDRKTVKKILEEDVSTSTMHMINIFCKTRRLVASSRELNCIGLDMIIRAINNCELG